jgi:hypothetical protein
MKIEDYIDQNLLDNIYSRNSNVLGVIANPDITNERKKCFGKVLLLVNIEKKKNINIKDNIEFYPNKIKWRSSFSDKKGRKLLLVDPYWCKLYIHDRKIHCPIRILKSKVEGTERIYYGIDEDILLTKNQFIKRKLLLKFAKTPHIIFEACENFNERWWTTKDYYRALNETSKHYLIKHDQLKIYIGEYNNAKKQFQAEWNNLLIKHYQNNESDQEFDKFYNDFEITKNESVVIPFRKSPKGDNS